MADELGPIATRVLFENDDVRVWEMDLAPGEVCGMHHHTLDYLLYIIDGSKVGVESPGHRSYEFETRPRCVYFIPAGGIESAHNVGSGRFREALFELKRAPGRRRPAPGYAACEALAGTNASPGTVQIFENDRVRLSETTLAPGANNSAKSRHDSVLFVIDGGQVEGSLKGKQASNAVRWVPRGTEATLQNRGNANYRQLTLEIK